MQLNRAVKQASILSGTRVKDAALALGVSPNVVSSRIASDSLTDAVYDVLDAFGYRVVLLPKDCVLPCDGIEVKR